MKKGLMFGVICIMFLSLCACSNILPKKNASPLIGIALPDEPHNWVKAVSYYAEKSAKELSLNYKLVKADSAAQQSLQLQEMIDGGCKAIVLLPVGDQSAAAQQVLDANIPLINFDRKLCVTPTCYVGGDNQGVGREGAKFIKRILPEGGNVAVFVNKAAGNVSTEREDAFRQELALNSGFQIVETIDCGSFTNQAGKAAMQTLFQKATAIDAVFAMDDELSAGVLDAVSESGKNNVKAIAGGGGMQELYRKMDTNAIAIGSAQYSPSMIDKCVELAREAALGKEIDKTVILPATLVEKANVAQFTDATSPY